MNYFSCVKELEALKYLITNYHRMQGPWKKHKNKKNHNKRKPYIILKSFFEILSELGLTQCCRPSRPYMTSISVCAKNPYLRNYLRTASPNFGSVLGGSLPESSSSSSLNFVPLDEICDFNLAILHTSFTFSYVMLQFLGGGGKGTIGKKQSTESIMPSCGALTCQPFYDSYVGENIWSCYFVIAVQWNEEALTLAEKGSFLAGINMFALGPWQKVFFSKWYVVMYVCTIQHTCIVPFQYYILYRGSYVFLLRRFMPYDNYIW